MKVDERLLFPLCSTCAKKYPHGDVLEDYSCPHTDFERGWVSTCTSLELNMALDEGYIVTKVYRVIKYEESDDELFRPYIAEFMKQKIESSGFDKKIKGNDDLEKKFITECKQLFGINIEKEKMNPNKGKRALAKLALNNLWGRFSLRNFGLSKTLITDDPCEFSSYLDNHKIDVTGIDTLTDHTALISYMEKKEFVEEHECSNIVISLWTTSAARIHLLRAMQKVARTPGCTLLYTDTDSLIFAHSVNNCPLQTGPHLGDLTDEYPDDEIVEYCSGGAKQYGLKLKKKNSTDNHYKHVLKVRGMTLSHDVIEKQNLCYETFKERVIKYVKDCDMDPIPILYPNFIRPSIPKDV
uniref:DNA-directed DNA polymerase n=1 Tax=Meloidogyne enterolobii TaxID=390850 RepID=A0A6V7XFH5_MELEN|nr:unnamed protein product [Meloidogyne enterolobii]